MLQTNCTWSHQLKIEQAVALQLASTKRGGEPGDKSAEL